MEKDGGLCKGLSLKGTGELGSLFSSSAHMGAF